MRDMAIQVGVTANDKSNHTWDTRTPECRVNQKNERNESERRAQISRIIDEPPVVGASKRAD